MTPFANQPTAAVIFPSYRTTITISPSSSSSSTSGVTTPVDGSRPVFVAFPKPKPSSPRDDSLVSSGSSSVSLSKHRTPSKSPHFFLTRPPKLSLDSSKAKPLPAAPSTPDDHSPLGAFSQTPSAEGHLRSIVSRAAHVPPSPMSAKEGLPIPFPASLAGRLRTSSLRSLALPTRVKHVASVFYRDADDNDSEEDRDSEESDGAEEFWPRRYVPTASRSPAHTTTSTASTSPRASPPNPRTRTFSSPSAPQRPSARTGEAVPKRPGPHVRASTEPGLSVFPRNNLQHHTISSIGFVPNRRPSLASAGAGVRPSRSFLGPPKSKKRAGELLGASASISAGAHDGTASTTLNPALAAVEHASRLRARCVCGVCGKAGVDYPRCPRCTATWCSRQCRVSGAAAGGARHTCVNAGAGTVPSLGSRQATIGA